MNLGIIWTNAEIAILKKAFKKAVKEQPDLSRLSLYKQAQLALPASRRRNNNGAYSGYFSRFMDKVLAKEQQQETKVPTIKEVDAMLAVTDMVKPAAEEAKPARGTTPTAEKTLVEALTPLIKLAETAIETLIRRLNAPNPPDPKSLCEAIETTGFSGQGITEALQSLDALPALGLTARTPQPPPPKKRRNLRLLVVGLLKRQFEELCQMIKETPVDLRFIDTDVSRPKLPQSCEGIIIDERHTFPWRDLALEIVTHHRIRVVRGPHEAAARALDLYSQLVAEAGRGELELA